MLQKPSLSAEWQEDQGPTLTPRIWASVPLANTGGRVNQKASLQVQGIEDGYARKQELYLRMWKSTGTQEIVNALGKFLSSEPILSLGSKVAIL